MHGGEGMPLLRMIAIYGAVAIWEIATTPVVSHSNSWHGVWISLLALPSGAYWMTRKPYRPSQFFLFGAAGSLLFLWRFLHMDRFSLWLQYQAPRTEVIVASWIAFTCLMGLACWFASKARLATEIIAEPNARIPSERMTDQ
jgi:hypothetical protein